jgi:hypothetical protein
MKSKKGNNLLKIIHEGDIHVVVEVFWKLYSCT